MDPIGATDHTKIRVYRQNRAGEARVQSGFYLNVTKLGGVDSKVREWLMLLNRFGK